MTDDRKHIGARIPVELYERMSAWSKDREGFPTMTDILIELIEAGLEAQKETTCKG